MKPTIQLKIDTPCHEDWNNMTPVDHGRFCQACVKQVVDFSTMTDQQILKYIAKGNGNICGRVSNDQLNRPLVPAAEQPKTKWWYAVLLPLVMVFNRAGAQQGAKQRSIPSTAIETGECTISGMVTNDKGQPVTGAYVTIEESGRTVVTDTMGRYKLNAHGYIDSLDISASFIGFKTVKIIMPARNTTAANFVLTEDPKILEDVIIKAYPSRSISCTMGGLSVVRRVEITAKDTLLKRIGMAPAFIIAPNPVRRGQQVTVKVKEWNEFTLQVIGSNGALLFSQQYITAKELPQQIAVPQNWMPGMYYIRVVNEKNRKTYIEKFMVQ